MNYLSQESQKPELGGPKPKPTPKLVDKPLLIQNTHLPHPLPSSTEKLP